MPCEGCNVQFTIFRRKRSCQDCKRFYCSNCLNVLKRHSHCYYLCPRCVVFARRPLLKADLLQLKPKDLIFYLQSKHISTAGCVEKDELVRLILDYVEHSDGRGSPRDEGTFSPTGSSGSRRSESTDPFENIKQTCQNIFSNITENLQDSFASFDPKGSAKFGSTSRCQPSSTTEGQNAAPPHVYQQPRVNTREMPTYASAQDNTIYSNSYNSNIPRSSRPQEPRDGSEGSSSLHHMANSPIVTSPTITPPSTPQASATATRLEILNECDCSNEDLIKCFQKQQMHVAEEGQEKHNKVAQTVDENEAGPSVRSSESNTSKPTKSNSSKIYIYEEGADGSSHSSFEELGAIGGTSDDSKAATDTTNSSQNEQWHILETPLVQTMSRAEKERTDGDSVNVKENVIETEPIVELPPEDNAGAEEDKSPPEAEAPPLVPQRVKKVTRRRSDSYLKRRRTESDEEDLETATVDTRARATPSTSPHGATDGEARACCKHCGKNKMSLKRHVDKMRRHLESAQMAEPEIKVELERFLAYLEKRAVSIDHSDTETVASPRTASGRTSVQDTRRSSQDTPHTEYTPRSEPDEVFAYNDDEGIHVYACDAAECSDQSTRFINLEDFENIDELENLTVKQLKEILMLNRVDFKGCCEKQELLDRVQRLWKTQKSTPAIDKLPTDELCKICMDAPIECVILECGHMATCTQCGKVLSECPICRQYIVRVVRFFKS